jgi:cytochrome c-type biogenesis protein CcmH
MRRVAGKAPQHPEALWYLGLDAAQHRDRDTARSYWERLVAELPEGSAERKTVEQAVEALKKPR